jgi:two-component system nitrate/nitrite response regulator NarL
MVLLAKRDGQKRPWRANAARAMVAARLLMLGAVRLDTRVLIVDDDDRLRDVLAVYLGVEEGLCVAGTASDAEEAAEMTAKLHPDAIVLDYHMPGIDGLDAILLLRDVAPDVRIVMFSADDDGVASETAIQRGAAGYVTKNGQQGLDDVVALLRAG